MIPKVLSGDTHFSKIKQSLDYLEDRSQKNTQN